MNFFLTFNLQSSFNSINKYRLKNIFLKLVGDLRLWNEIDKMWSAGLIDFSFSLVEDEDFFSIFFCKFLFNFYLAELDLYVTNSLSLYFDSYFYTSSKFSFFSISKLVSNDYVSLKVGKSFVDLKSLKISRTTKLYSSSFLNKLTPTNVTFFEKRIHYVRYLEFVLIGIVGSKAIAMQIKEKVLSFLKGNLHLSISNFNLTCTSQAALLFLGYSIKFSLLDSFYDSSKKNFSIYSNKLFSRLNTQQEGFAKILLSRLYTEFSVHIKNLFSEYKNFLTSNNNKFFLYLFQLESVRSMQISKLVLTNDFSDLFPTKIFFRNSNFNFNEFVFYEKYFFDVYLTKVKKRLGFSIQSIPIFLEKSFFPIDLSFEFLFTELNKKLSIVYNKTKNLQMLKVNKLRSLYLGKIHNFFGLLFSVEDVKLLSKACYYSVSFRSLCFFEINISVKNVFMRLRNLGFVHFNRYRPISNSKYLFFDDSYIIACYGYLAYFLINWFGYADNFTKIRLLVEYLRQSCFLTLCRKHNKNKNWSYNVFTTNLVVCHNLFVLSSFYPTRRNILYFRKKFFLINFFNKIHFL